ncbi:PD-(D/E)XK nuclease family protein [Acholeplasma equifetale]|uniref:PD-(D/E)XK nuclease family protein n=1 Tax=Acholeplasma equifetale TaxID=264634 RepID=UPI00047E4B56|nr:PD-(D/E)XK nuclease family protein [Acholeplasma equifetale]
MIDILLKYNDSKYVIVVDDAIYSNFIKLKSEYELTHHHLFKFKLMSHKELLTKLSFSYENHLILDIYAKTNEPISIIKEKLKFLSYVDDTHALKEFIHPFINQLHYHHDFIEKNKDSLFIFLSQPIYLKKLLDKHQLKYEVILESNKYIPKVYQFDTMEEEIFYLFESISHKLESGISPDSIYIAGINDKNERVINKLALSYGISIDMAKDLQLWNFKYTQNLIKLSIEELIKKIVEPTENQIEQRINELIVQILNRYPLHKYDEETTKKIIVSDIKEAKLRKDRITNVIHAIKFEEVQMLNEDALIYVIHANYSYFPNIKKDNEFLSNEEKLQIGYPTSHEENLYHEKLFTYLLQTKRIEYVSFSLKDIYQEYVPSDIIKQFNNIEPRKISKEILTHKFSLNTYKSFFKSTNEDKLLTTFNNDFKLNASELNILKQYIQSLDLKLSPSQIITYLKSPYIFYIQNILKISNFDVNIPIFMGDFFHKLVETALIICYFEKINQRSSKNDLDKRIDDLIIEFEAKEFDENIFFDDFFDVYFEDKRYIFEKEINNLTLDEILIIQAEFFIQKNKKLMIQSLSEIILRSNSANKVYVETDIESINLKGRLDLLIENDESFEIIDFKSSDQSTLKYEKIEELLCNLINENPIDKSDLQIIQLIAYAYLGLKRYNKDIFVEFFAFLSEKTSKNIRLTLNQDDEIFSISEKIIKNYEQIVNNVYYKIMNAEFPNRTLETKKRDELIEKDLNVYKALAYYTQYNTESEDEDIDE